MDERRSYFSSVLIIMTSKKKLDLQKKKKPSEIWEKKKVPLQSFP